MPIKRRVAKQRRQHEVPAWAERLKAGECPVYASAANDQFAEWAFFGAEVPGLPMAESPEGQRLWMGTERCR